MTRVNFHWPMSNFRSPAAMSRFLIPAVAGLGIDLWTKSLSFARLAAQVSVDEAGLAHVVSHPPIKFIPGWIEFEVTANQGAVFGIGQGQRGLFVLVAVLAVAFLLWLFATSGRQWFFQILLGAVAAGVLGNLYDRVVFGYVRDMIHALPQWPHLFPWIFNVADSLLCVGISLMLLLSFKPHKPDGGKPDGHTGK
jgi:signal peptidase II